MIGRHLHRGFVRRHIGQGPGAAAMQALADARAAATPPVSVQPADIPLYAPQAPIDYGAQYGARFQEEALKGYVETPHEFGDLPQFQSTTTPGPQPGVLPYHVPPSPRPPTPIVEETDVDEMDPGGRGGYIPSFCELNPNDPSCLEPTGDPEIDFCLANPNDPSCLEPTGDPEIDFCLANPNDPSCLEPTGDPEIDFCLANPNDPSCLPITEDPFRGNGNGGPAPGYDLPLYMGNGVGPSPPPPGPPPPGPPPPGPMVVPYATPAYSMPDCPPYPMGPILNAPASIKRRWGVSFFQAILASAQGVTVTVRPQHCFRPDQLIIPSTIAPNFDIVSIVIGTQPQLVATGVTSATIYSEVSINNQQIFDVVKPGVEVIITVNNLTAAAQTFQATLLGLALD